jgi:hypothetical protein
MMPSLGEARKLPAGDTRGRHLLLYMLGHNSSEEMSLPLAAVHEGRD